MCRGLYKHFQGGGVLKFFRWLRFFRDICNYMRYKFKAFLWDVVNFQKNKLGLSLGLGNHYVFDFHLCNSYLVCALILGEIIF